jgi:hypothetical protein
MTIVGKALTQAFYGMPARFSYFTGTSTGGRQGLMEAQRYPDDYDGILAGCPAINWDRMIPAAIWAQEVMLRSGTLVPKSKLDAATRAAVQACDTLDHIADGVIEDPSQCAYDPRALVGLRVGDGLFSDADATVIRQIWEGPRGKDGRFLWYGLPRGADLSGVAATGGAPLIGQPFGVALEWLQYFLVQNPSWDWRSLAPGEYEQLFNQSAEEYDAVIGSDSPDLARFRTRGGRLILYHGLADQLVPVKGTIDYYERVQQRMGATATAKFVRLFLAPGVDHGFVGAGPSPTGMMDTIIRWVEAGEAPQRLLAKLPGLTGRTVRTRPIFPYPQVATYKGSGSTDEASNFISTLPTCLRKSLKQCRQAAPVRQATRGDEQAVSSDSLTRVNASAPGVTPLGKLRANARTNIPRSEALCFPRVPGTALDVSSACK